MRNTARPDIRTGPDGTTYAVVEFNIFAALPGSPDAGAIHLTTPAAPGFHTTVNNTPGSARYHGNLYGHLRDILVEAGRWPSGLDSDG
jgi:hypothetical protein